MFSIGRRVKRVVWCSFPLPDLTEEHNKLSFHSILLSTVLMLTVVSVEIC